MKKLLTVALILATISTYGQTAEDFFTGRDYEVQWLGIDFSQVKLVGDFSQFSGAGPKDPGDLQSQYFPAWNRLLLNEPEKYDLREFFRLRDLEINIKMIMKRNSDAETEDMLTYNPEIFSKKDIRRIAATYDIEDEEGLGVILIAESLNKIDEEAYFHFVVLNLKTILV